KEETRGIVLQVNWGNEPAVEPNKPGDPLGAQVKEPLRVQQERRDHWRAHVAAPQALSGRQVRFALSSEGLSEPADFFKSVRQAVAAGLSRQAALAALTQDAALLLGQSRRLGTLAPGKLAHVVVLSGPFDD